MKYCSSCFQRIAEEARWCPYCGHNNEETICSYAIPAGSILRGKYRIGRVIGQDGFGVTYKALGCDDKKMYVIREFYPEVLVTRHQNGTVSVKNPSEAENFDCGRAGFLQEAETLIGFRNEKGIVYIYECFEENNTAYFVMRFMKGRNLKDYLREHDGRMNWEKLRDVLYPVMDALEEIHEAGILHRGICPDSVFLTEQGEPVLINFGTARTDLGNRSRNISGTLNAGFAPVEQYTVSGKQGPFTDIYALAATAYCALTGLTPPKASARAEWLRNKKKNSPRTDPLAPIHEYAPIDPQIEAVLLKALSLEPKKRYASIRSFRKALIKADRWDDSAQGLLDDAVTGRKPHRPKKRRKWAFLVVGVIVAAAAALWLTLGAKMSDTPVVLKNVTEEEPPETVALITKETLYEENGTLDHWIECGYDANGNSTMDVIYNSDGSIRLWDGYIPGADGGVIGYVECNADGSINYRSEISYDDDGNMIREDWYNSDGSVYGWVECTNDADGNVLRMAIYNSDNSIENWAEYTYDDDGNEIKKEWYNGDGSPNVWWESAYDEEGNLTELIGYYADGVKFGEDEIVLVQVPDRDTGLQSTELLTKEMCYEDDDLDCWYEYSYNGDGVLIGYTEYDSDGDVDEWVGYMLDEDGSETGYIRCDDDGSVSYRAEYTRDDDGRVVLETRYKSDGSFYQWIEFTYDADGYVSRETYYEDDGSIKNWAEYTYNARGEITKKVWYNRDCSVDCSWETTRDDDGNIVEAKDSITDRTTVYEHTRTRVSVRDTDGWYTECDGRNYNYVIHQIY